MGRITNPKGSNVYRMKQALGLFDPIGVEYLILIYDCYKH